MKYEEIKSAVLVPRLENFEQSVLENEVEGVKLLWRTLPAGGTAAIPAEEQCVRVFIIVQGEAAVRSGGTEELLGECGIYVPLPEALAEISTSSGACVLELRRRVTDAEWSSFRKDMSGPYTIEYDDAPTYSEDCKSEKTVSRMLIPEGAIPRFAMGSVETAGDDLIAPHEHPMLEQIFLGMNGNDCTVLINGLEYPFSERMLLHIPLGASHGVRSRGSQRVRYFWMDFLLNETAIEYMRTAHKMNGS